MKRLSSLLTFSAVALLSAVSIAAPTAPKAKAKRTSTADVYERLAEGKLEVPTRVTVPKSIPASESAEGFYVEAPAAYGGSDVTYAQIFGSKEAAQRQQRGEDATVLGCFQTAYPNSGQEQNWSGNMSPSTIVQNYKSQRYGGGGPDTSVQMVRSDRIVTAADGKLDLEVKFAFVDAETHGVRLHTESRLQLALLGELPGKVQVYGAKSGEDVSFVVRREKQEKERFFFGSVMAAVNSQHVGSASDSCPVVFSMKASKGGADSGVVQLDAVLGVTEVENDGGFLAQMPMRHMPMESELPREARVRSMRIGFSSTWLSEDTKPVVSFSFGWLGKERVQPI
jgi:hypothetical protein